ncbi:MAG: NUDIX hydrolase [Eubacterium sp.]|nr:NUDIX hydrolase [Candidatus Colimonas fimequi]
MIFEEKFVSREEIYDGAIMKVVRDKVTVPKGYSHREVIEHNGAVCMVALTDDKKLVMEKQFRYVIGRPVLEIPAGKIDEGETDPVNAAIRELKEETGYVAKNIKHLGTLSPSVAYTKELIYVYLMTGLTNTGETELDPDEALDVMLMDFDEVYEMAAKGELIDVKTIAALFMAKSQMPELFE